MAAEGHREGVAGHHAIHWQLANDAPRLPRVHALSDGPEVGGIPVALVRVALPAERLKVLQDVLAAVLAGDDVVHLQRLLLARGAAKLAG